MEKSQISRRYIEQHIKTKNEDDFDLLILAVKAANRSENKQMKRKWRKRK